MQLVENVYVVVLEYYKCFLNNFVQRVIDIRWNVINRLKIFMACVFLLELRNM